MLCAVAVVVAGALPEDPTAVSAYHVAELDVDAQASGCNGGWPVVTFAVTASGPVAASSDFVLLAP